MSGLLPQALLRAMEKRNYLFTFGLDAAPSTIDACIAKPGPVRVWYNTGMVDAQGHRMARGRDAQVEVISKLDYGVTWAMLRVFVVIDQQQGQITRRMVHEIAP
jgi:hypothetical protein